MLDATRYIHFVPTLFPCVPTLFPETDRPLKLVARDVRLCRIKARPAGEAAPRF